MGRAIRQRIVFSSQRNIEWTLYQSVTLCLPMVYIHYLNKLVITELDGQLATTVCILLFDLRVTWLHLTHACRKKGMAHIQLLLSNDWKTARSMTTIFELLCTPGYVWSCLKNAWRMRLIYSFRTTAGWFFYIAEVWPHRVLALFCPGVWNLMQSLKFKTLKIFTLWK